MKLIRDLLIFASTLILIISACKPLPGIHNPRRAGAYPAATRKRVLLGTTSLCRSCFDVNYYALELKPDPLTRFISGRVRIDATAQTDLDTIQLDLYPNLKLLSVTMKSTDLIFRRVAGAVFIRTPRHLKKSEHFSLQLQYEGKPRVAEKPPWSGGFVWSKDKNGNPFIGVACESEGAAIWWPTKDDVSDEPDSADISIRVPAKLTAVSNGVLRGKKLHEDSSITFSWHVSYPINNYNLTLYVGDYALVEDIYHSELTGKNTALNYYVLSYNKDIAKEHFKQVKKQLAFYEKMFGEYPWQRDGYKLVESPYAGMEHQSAIAYGNGFKNDESHPYFDFIVLHETAHEWWGNSVTAADLADAWIHEGFATYAEALYVEANEGRNAYLKYMGWKRLLILNKRPLVRKRGIRYFDYHDPDIYYKGSVLLHTLRTLIDNDPLFFDIIKTFREQNHLKQIYSNSFTELVNAKTGKDYTWFFKQYLYDRRVPILEIYWAPGELYYRWTETADDFVMPVEIMIPGGERIRLMPTTKIQKKAVENLENFSLNTLELYFGTKENKKLERKYKPE